MATANQLAQQYIQQVKEAPSQMKHAIMRDAAKTFMGLAQQQNEAHAQKRLADLGLMFANEASRTEIVVDDFTDLLRETQQAYDEVGDDPQELQARRREIHDERTARPPGFVSIAPESFNKDATLGRSAVIKFAPTDDEKKQGIVQAQNVAFWQGVKKEAQAMTVDVNLGFLPPPFTTGDGSPPPPFNVRPYGEVEFGSDGNRTKVKFDVAFGKRLTVVGNYIAVTLGCDQPREDPGSGDHPTVPLTAGASIGAFAAPSPAPLVLTQYIDGLVAGADAVVPIPLKAVSLLSIQADWLPGDNALFTFLSYGGVAMTFFDFTVGVSEPAPLPIPIGGDVSFLQVSNPGGGSTRNFRLIFQLAL